MMTRFGNSRCAVKFGVLIAGFLTFFIGVFAATGFTSTFSSKYIPLMIVLLAIGLVVYKFKKTGGCCSG